MLFLAKGERTLALVGSNPAPATKVVIGSRDAPFLLVLNFSGRIPNEMNEELIAPCGMNCGICSGYLAFKSDVKSQGIRMPYCTGCRPRDKQCSFLKKRCHRLLSGQIQYCYECADFPCENLRKLDKRYRTHFRMSMIENLANIKENGMRQFLEKQEEKWKCPECGGVICCHNGICFSCGLDLLKNKKKRYRWEDD